MPLYDARVHSVEVVTSDSATGNIRVTGLAGNMETIEVSGYGREKHTANDKWLVPAAGDNIIVCQEDADCTKGVFWINTTVPPDPPYTFDDNLNTRFGTGDDAVLQVDRTSGQIRVNTPTAETEPSGGLYYPLVVKATNSSWPAIKITPGGNATYTTRASIMLHKTIMGAGSTAGHEGDWYVYDSDNSKWNLHHTGHDDTTTGGLTIRSTGLAERWMQLCPAYVSGGSEYSAIFRDNANVNILMNGALRPYNVIPYVNSTYDLGSASIQWSQIYLVNNPIVSSDQNYKTDIVDSNLGLDFVNALRPVSFKLTHTDGREGVRTHYGLIAQEVESVLGADASDTAIWTKETIEASPEVPADEYLPGRPAVEEHEKQGLRYEELISPMIKAIQELTTRLTALESA